MELIQHPISQMLGSQISTKMITKAKTGRISYSKRKFYVRNPHNGVRKPAKAGRKEVAGGLARAGSY